MVVRLTFLNFLPGKQAEAKKIYHDEIVAVVKQQKGNLDCRLLEPLNEKDEYISMTVWDNQQDADAYQDSGTYKKLVDRVKTLYATSPILKVYTAEDVLEHA